ncbi:hypothetical protein BGW80DRAFT_1255654 [Lactifluus volemus]|nr:hypothetical protein BGW80DRAFT_1255654 [Lactifluus volemus]
MATFLSSNILIFGPSSLQSLLPVTSISQAEALLENHRIQDVIELADKQRKKVEGKFVVDPDECLKPSQTLCKADELAYIYQRIGFRCLLETRFEDAGFCLFQGELDPRILISYFPELRGTLLDANPTLEIFSGIAERMPPYESIDDIIVRTRRKNDGPGCEESEVIILPQVEPVFRAVGQYCTLCKMYSKCGDDATLLDLWSKLIVSSRFQTCRGRMDSSRYLSHSLTHPPCSLHDEIDSTMGRLAGGRGHGTCSQAHGSTKRGQKAGDEAATLQQISVVNPDTAAGFLEHLVLQKRRTDPAFHTELALICIDEFLSFLADGATSRLWQAKGFYFVKSSFAMT